MHIFDQALELVLIEDSYTFTVDSFEFSCELAQEVLVLLKLEVEDNIGKFLESDSTFQLYLFALRIFLFPCELASRLHATNQIVQVSPFVQIRYVVRLVYASGEEVGAELVFFGLFLRFDQFVDLLEYLCTVTLVIHLCYHFPPG